MNPMKIPFFATTIGVFRAAFDIAINLELQLAMVAEQNKRHFCFYNVALISQSPNHLDAQLEFVII